MNTTVKTLVSALLAVTTLNAASAEEASLVKGKVGAKYASDYHRRGEILSAEALQAQVGFNVGLGSVDVFGDFFTNQSTDSGAVDTDEATLGVATSLFEDTFNAYAGVYNTDTEAASSDLEAFVSLQANVLLSPTVSVYRDTDDAFYTFEGQLSYDLGLEVVNLELAGILGNTETAASSDQAYYGAKLTASKTLKDNLNIYADNEALWGIGLSVSF